MKSLCRKFKVLKENVTEAENGNYKELTNEHLSESALKVLRVCRDVLFSVCVYK